MNQVSLEFAESYRSLTGFTLAELRSDPALLQIPEYNSHMQFCSQGQTHIIPSIMHYSGLIRWTNQSKDLVRMALSNGNPWEMTMTLLALTGWPHPEVLQESYIDCREQLHQVWQTLLKLKQDGKVPKACFQWLKLKIDQAPEAFPLDIRVIVNDNQ